jgi:hypothetical protein
LLPLRFGLATNKKTGFISRLLALLWNSEALV